MREKLLALCDAAAEALILVDLDDERSVAELPIPFEHLIEAFGSDIPAQHPAYDAVWAARAVATEGNAALGRCENAFLRLRREAEKAESAAAEKPARTRAAKGKTAAAVAPEPAAQPAPTPATAEKPSDVMPLAGDEELLRDFAVRAAEHLDDADEALLRLEGDPNDYDAIDSVFRAFHTIKGMAGFLALDAVSAHAHASESLLAAARTDRTAVDPRTIQALFSAVDGMRGLVAGGSNVAPVVPDVNGEHVAANHDAAAPAPQATVASGSRAAESARQGTVRMDEVRLDALLDTIGELVIAESMVSSATRNGADEASLLQQLERLDKITRELQQMATSLRMVPMRAMFRRMARLVRDLSHKAGKQVEFVTSGEDTELDKTVVDRIEDPLIHALRNAVDHGIETAEERIAAGKSPVAHIELHAFHAGGSIHVEISDDGRGLDADKILKKARTLGMVTAEERPSDDALFDLVYAPGFSTAEKVTDVSGRGVGMDVVRRTVEELRGRIKLQSAAGEGTTVSVRLPVTLAIIDGMVCRVGEERYILPVLSIQRSVRPAAGDISTVQGGRGLLLSTAEELLPIVALHDLLAVDGAQPDPTEAVVVIVDEGGVRAGLLVDELLGQQQTVIKPLGDGLGDQPGIAGGAIMPDGRVGLILDAAGLVRIAHR